MLIKDRATGVTYSAEYSMQQLEELIMQAEEGRIQLVEEEE